VSTLSDLLERAVLGLVTRLSGWIVAVIALLFYPGAGLLLPLALHWSTGALVEANLLGTVLAGVISLGWLSAQIEAAKRRHLVEWTTDLRLLSAEEFEWLVVRHSGAKGGRFERPAARTHLTAILILNSHARVSAQSFSASAGNLGTSTLMKSGDSKEHYSERG